MTFDDYEITARMADEIAALKAERDRLTAERGTLALERERLLETTHSDAAQIGRLLDQRKRLQAERDSLAALLREAREFLFTSPLTRDAHRKAHDDLLPRIDAALEAK